MLQLWGEGLCKPQPTPPTFQSVDLWQQARALLARAGSTPTPRSTGETGACSQAPQQRSIQLVIALEVQDSDVGEGRSKLTAPALSVECLRCASARARIAGRCACNTCKCMNAGSYAEDSIPMHSSTHEQHCMSGTLHACTVAWWQLHGGSCTVAFELGPASVISTVLNITSLCPCMFMQGSRRQGRTYSIEHGALNGRDAQAPSKHSMGQSMQSQVSSLTHPHTSPQPVPPHSTWECLALHVQACWWPRLLQAILPCPHQQGPGWPPPGPI